MKQLLLLISIFFVSTLSAQAPQEIITEIRFQGLKATSENDALSTLQIRPGEIYTPEKGNFALKDLNGMQRFKDIKLDVVRRNSGVILTFIVEEESLIDKIIFEGVSTLKANKLRDEIDLNEGTSFREAKARAAVFQIKEYYRGEGNLEAEVSYRLDPIKQLPGQFDLVFEVKENEKIVVRAINFTGVNVFRPRELEGKMKTKKKLWIFRSGVLKEDEFLVDKQTLIAFYQENGYMDMQITNFAWEIQDINTTNKQGEITKSIRGIAINIGISEGEQFTVGDFSFKDNTIFATKELEKYITLKKGDIYNKTKIEQIRANIYKLYADRGYLFANVSAVETKSKDNVIKTDFVIFEGARAHIENIVVRGNDKTLPSVVRRYLQIKEGELYANNKLEQSFNRLMQTQFFSDVRIEPSPGSSDGLVNVDFVVTEGQTGMIEFQLGYGTVSGFSGGIKLTERNLLGRGYQISIRGEYGQFRQSAEISFTDPSVNNSPFSLSVVFGVFNSIFEDIPTDENGDGIIDGTDFDWYNNRQSTLNSFVNTGNSYTRLSFRMGLAVGIQFAVYWNANVGYELNVFRDSNATFSKPLTFDGQWRIDEELINSFAADWTVQSSIYSTLRFNNTDGGLWPTRGINTALFVNFAGIGGDIRFINLTANFDAYWNPFWKVTVAFHYDMAFLFPQFDGGFAIRDANRLSFDGVYKMRGWLNYFVRGEASSYFSIETRVPIWEFIGAVAFWDYGALFGNYKEFTYHQPSYIMSFGAGLALNLPVLPIRIYGARPVEWDPASGQFKLANSRRFEEAWEFVFSIQGLF